MTFLAPFDERQLFLKLLTVEKDIPLNAVCLFSFWALLDEKRLFLQHVCRNLIFLSQDSRIKFLEQKHWKADKYEGNRVHCYFSETLCKVTCFDSFEHHLMKQRCFWNFWVQKKIFHWMQSVCVHFGLYLMRKVYVCNMYVDTWFSCHKIPEWSFYTRNIKKNINMKETGFTATFLKLFANSLVLIVLSTIWWKNTIFDTFDCRIRFYHKCSLFVFILSFARWETLISATCM